jgi:precorrin-6Y C5,15-methyltransferase (decarboxylating)
MPAIPALTVVGIGVDGWDGLSPAAAAELTGADVVIGSARQIALVAGRVAETEVWPSPMTEALPGLRHRFAGRRAVVLASGDPMFYGVGATLIRLFGAEAVRIVPHPSSVSLACARLGWAQPEVDVISVVGRPLSLVQPWIAPGRRLLILVSEADKAARIAELLRDRGVGDSAVTVLERLGGPAERISTATDWAGRTHDPLAIVAVECATGGRPLSRTPGLPDDAFDSDGALTKQDVRAVTLAALAPLPGQLLWDIGAGSGSIAVEWMRTHAACRAAAVESRADRRERIVRNAETLGVPGLCVVAGRAPEALRDLPEPDAVFIGGGLTTPGVVEACLAALRPGGRLVANGVTIETESALADLHARFGGRLTRIAISHAAPMGTFTSFRPALPVTQWTHLRS